MSRLILCEPAPNVRVMLGARYAGNDKIAVRKPEDIADDAGAARWTSSSCIR